MEIIGRKFLDNYRLLDAHDKINKIEVYFEYRGYKNISQRGYYLVAIPYIVKGKEVKKGKEFKLLIDTDDSFGEILYEWSLEKVNKNKIDYLIGQIREKYLN